MRSAAPEKLEGIKTDGPNEIVGAPVKLTPTPTEEVKPTPTEEPQPQPQPVEEPKPKPSEEPKPQPTPTEKPKPTPDPAYQVEDPAVARAAFDAHRSGSALPGLAAYNGNDCRRWDTPTRSRPWGRRRRRR